MLPSPFLAVGIRYIPVIENVKVFLLTYAIFLLPSCQWFLLSTLLMHMSCDSVAVHFHLVISRVYIKSSDTRFPSLSGLLFLSRSPLVLVKTGSVAMFESYELDPI